MPRITWEEDYNNIKEDRLLKKELLLRDASRYAREKKRYHDGAPSFQGPSNRTRRDIAERDLADRSELYSRALYDDKSAWERLRTRDVLTKWGAKHTDGKKRYLPVELAHKIVEDKYEGFQPLYSAPRGYDSYDDAHYRNNARSYPGKEYPISSRLGGGGSSSLPANARVQLIAPRDS